MLGTIYDNILPQEVQKSVSLLSKHLWIAAKRRGDEDFWNWGCIIMCYLVFYNQKSSQFQFLDHKGCFSCTSIKNWSINH